MNIKQMFCDHDYVMLKWDEKVVQKDCKERICYFYLKCKKCYKRTYMLCDVRFDLIK